MRALAVIAGLCLVPSVLALVWPRSAPPPKPPVVEVAAASDVQQLWLGRKIDLNAADANALQIVRGIGPALAARVVADREEQGPFTSVDEVDRVKGIGPVLAARVADYFTVQARPGTSKAAAESDPPASAPTPDD